MSSKEVLSYITFEPEWGASALPEALRGIICRWSNERLQQLLRWSTGSNLVVRGKRLRVHRQATAQHFPAAATCRYDPLDAIDSSVFEADLGLLIFKERSETALLYFR